MSQQDYYAGFNFSRIGAMQFTLQASTGGNPPDTVNYLAGNYAHYGFTCGTDVYTKLATDIQTYLNGLGGGRPTYTVTFDEATMRYSFDSNTGTLALAFPGSAAGTIAKHVLGYSADVAATSSAIVSDRRPYYAIRAAVEAPSAYSFVYEDGSNIYEDRADDGTKFGISARTLPKFLDWEQRMEVKAAPTTAVVSGSAVGGAGIEIADASTEVPWTWEHFVEHVRVWEPFVFHNSTGPTGVICKMRKDTAFHKPGIVVPDHSNLWNIIFKTDYYGRY